MASPQSSGHLLMVGLKNNLMPLNRLHCKSWCDGIWFHLREPIYLCIIENFWLYGQPVHST